MTTYLSPRPDKFDISISITLYENTFKKTASRNFVLRNLKSDTAELQAVEAQTVLNEVVKELHAITRFGID